MVVTTPGIKATRFRASGPGRRGFAAGLMWRECGASRLPLFLPRVFSRGAISAFLLGEWAFRPSRYFALSKAKRATLRQVKPARGTLSLESMFCSGVTFEFIHRAGVCFEVKCNKGRVTIRRSKLTECLMPFAAGTGGWGEGKGGHECGSGWISGVGIPAGRGIYRSEPAQTPRRAR